MTTIILDTAASTLTMRQQSVAVSTRTFVLYADAPITLETGVLLPTIAGAISEVIDAVIEALTGIVIASDGSPFEQTLSRRFRGLRRG